MLNWSLKMNRVQALKSYRAVFAAGLIGLGVVAAGLSGCTRQGLSTTESAAKTVNAITSPTPIQSQSNNPIVQSYRSPEQTIMANVPYGTDINTILSLIAGAVATGASILIGKSKSNKLSNALNNIASTHTLDNSKLNPSTIAAIHKVKSA
jgi:hypothetical protein